MKDRNYGIDLLRIVSMIMIAMLHVLGQGGLLYNSPYFSANNYLFWALEILCFCSVNTYAMISGYVEYDKKIKYSNLIYLYIEVLFYNLLICLSFYVFKRDTLSVKSIIKSFLPVSTQSYWYFSSYFVLFLFLPHLNNFTKKLSKKDFKILLIVFFIVFSILPTMSATDFVVLKEGYSPLWLGVMYIFGSYIKKYDVKIFKRNRNNLLGYFLCILLTIFSNYFFKHFSYNLFGEVKYIEYFVKYNSPTILLSAIFLIVYFSNINLCFSFKKIISFFAPLAFGVYLIHVNPLIWDNIFKNLFTWIADYSFMIELLLVIACSLGIWLLCSLIDKVRLIFFNRLKIREFSKKVEERISLFFQEKITEK